MNLKKLRHLINHKTFPIWEVSYNIFGAMVDSVGYTHLYSPKDCFYCTQHTWVGHRKIGEFTIDKIIDCKINCAPSSPYKKIDILNTLADGFVRASSVCINQDTTCQFGTSEYTFTCNITRNPLLDVLKDKPYLYLMGV